MEGTCTSRTGPCGVEAMECMFQVNRSQSLFLSSNSCGPWETALKGWSDNSDQYKQGPLTSRGRSRGARPILANGQRSLEAGDACRPGTTRGPLNSDASLVEVGLKAPNRVLPFCRPFPKMMVETAEPGASQTTRLRSLPGVRCLTCLGAA